jgi:hypothetical protein
MFRPASRSITQTQGYVRLGRRVTDSAKIIGAAAAIALLASANSFATAAEASPQMPLEQHACAVVMGLHSPGELYETCIRSLDETLSELDRARSASTNRSACARKGLEPGTPAYAVCLVNAE